MVFFNGTAEPVTSSAVRQYLYFCTSKASKLSTVFYFNSRAGDHPHPALKVLSLLALLVHLFYFNSRSGDHPHPALKVLSLLALLVHQ